ncbi:MAG: hypothetical protein KDA83_07560 [Planctomycetales bacterium]|nr:hypothetical protein [Planctomycetales bacterium]
MPSVVRNILAVVAGFIIGSIVNIAIVSIGPLVIPPPEGVDMTDMDQLAENMKLLKPANFIAPFLAHALGSLVGAFVVAMIATKYKMIFALGIGAFFMLGGITMVAMVGGPIWFILLDLIGAYLPMGYLGGVLAGANRPSPE